MKSYICSYAGFDCLLTTENVEIVTQFKNEFGFYYDIYEINEKIKHAAEIVIVDKGFTEDIKSEKICIHSSHSRNIKYLLDGSKYTQKDASIYAYRKITNDDILYYIENTDTRVRMEKGACKVQISGVNLYSTLVYVYETLLNLYIEHSGGILLHAASCKWNNKGYIISGKSGKGKTTLLMAMQKDGAIFHSNDRVAIFLEDEKITAYSIPIPVNVPIKVMQELKNWENTVIVKQAEVNSKIRFNVTELDQLFGENRLKKININSIIDVSYSDSDSMCQLINSGNVSEYLELLSPFDENHPKWLPMFTYPSQNKISKKLKEMQQYIKIYKISGSDTFAALSTLK